jgi:DNA-binding SARP family transcriptional activator/tetratricopeptide (TPR) repeat protein
VDPYGGVVEFLLLGPLEVRAGARTVPMRSPKQRTLLAALVVNAGRAVRVDELVEMMWGATPPDNPRGAVQIHVNRLRTALGGGHLISTGPAGYRLDVPPSRVDLGRLRLAVAAADRAAAARDLAAEDAELGAALALWRGEPLVDVPAEPLHREFVPGLVEQRALLRERWVSVQLRRGRHAEMVGELRGLVAQYPLRERFWAQLMTALHRGGQQAEALEAYRAVRALLAEELGVDPGPELRRVHAWVLSGATDLEPAAAGPRSPHPAPAYLTGSGGPEAAGAYLAGSGGGGPAGTYLPGSDGSGPAGAGAPGSGGLDAAGAELPGADGPGSAEAGRLARGSDPPAGSAGDPDSGTADRSGGDPGRPGGAVSEAESAGDPRMDGATRRAEGAPWAVHSELPMDVVGFVGREEVVTGIASALLGRDGVPVVVVSGAPGVGKSALAIRVAHQLRAGFPDGQWFVRLDGGGPSPRPVGQVLDGLLRVAGVDLPATAGDLVQRSALLRSRLAGRRVLIVLDDAADAAQVELLLPGTSGCAVLVTSRNELAGLTARYGARRWPLDVLSATDATDLITAVIGPARAQAEPAAVADLAALCDRLPLALRIVAANVAVRPRTPLAALARSLHADRLAGLAVPGDPHLAVRAAFDTAYAALAEEARRGFRLLGLVDGPTVTPPALAALLGGTEAAAAELLDSLAAGNLIERQGEDRYRFHDLIRLYAAERAASDEPAPERAAARERLLEWYLRATNAALAAAYPLGVRLPVPEAPAVGDTPLFDSDTAALDWLRAERANLVAATESAGGHHAYLLAEALRIDFHHRHRVEEWSRVLTAGLRAARELGNRSAAAVLQCSAGLRLWVLEQLPEAIATLREALLAAEEVDVPGLVPSVLNNLGIASSALGELDRANGYYSRALAVAGDNPHVRIMLLSNLGTTHSASGELATSRDYLVSALDLARAEPVPFRQLYPRFNLGMTCRLLGDLPAAREHLDWVLDHSRAAQAVREELIALVGLAAVHRDAGRIEEALACARSALDRAREQQPRLEADAQVELGAIHNALLRFDRAEQHFAAALALLHRLGEPENEGYALAGLALAKHRLGRSDEGIDLAEQAIAVTRRRGFRVEEGMAHTTLAQLHTERGNHLLAGEHAAQADKLHRATGHRLGLADALTIRGRAAAADNRLSDAVRHWHEAADLYLAIGSPKAATIRTLLVATPTTTPA